MAKAVCDQCGGERIQVSAKANINTGEIYDWDPWSAWCLDCKDSTTLPSPAHERWEESKDEQSEEGGGGPVAHQGPGHSAKDDEG